MNHHPLHLDTWYAEPETQFGKNVVVGNLVYSVVLGMSVPDVSGAAVANLEVEEAQAPEAHFPRRHDLRRDQGARDEGVVEQARSRDRDRGDPRVQPARRRVCYFRRKVMVPKREAAQPRLRPYKSPE